MPRGWEKKKNFLENFCTRSRVGHCVLLRSEHNVLQRSFKTRCFQVLLRSEHKVLLRSCCFQVLLRSFFEFLATYETQKNNAFFCILFLRTYKNAENATFFCKERKRMPRTLRSFAKNIKERENFLFFCKRVQKNAEQCVFFLLQYINIQIYTDK